MQKNSSNRLNLGKIWVKVTLNVKKKPFCITHNLFFFYRLQTSQQYTRPQETRVSRLAKHLTLTFIEPKVNFDLGKNRKKPY